MSGVLGVLLGSGSDERQIHFRDGEAWLLAATEK